MRHRRRVPRHRPGHCCALCHWRGLRVRAGRSDGKVVTGPGTLSNVVTQIDAVGGKGKGMAVQCDLSKPDQVGEAIGRIVAQLGRIDVLCEQRIGAVPGGSRGS